MPAKYRLPIWVEPVPGICSPKLPAAKGKRVDYEYIGFVIEVFPGLNAPAPYKAYSGRTIFHRCRTGYGLKVGRCRRASSESPF